jgi:hypothetical protein
MSKELLCALLALPLAAFIAFLALAKNWVSLKAFHEGLLKNRKET